MNGYWSYISERKLNRTLHRLVGLELCNAKAVLGRPVLLLFCERAERCRAFGIRLNARLLLNSALIEFAHCTFRPRDDELERFEHFFSHLKLGQVVTQWDSEANTFTT